MVNLLQTLFTRPFYHLFVAGTSVTCSRLMFILSGFYGYLLTHAVFNAAAMWFNGYLTSTGFPFASFGKHLPYCSWTLLNDRETPAYIATATTYFSQHGITIISFSWAIRAAACIGALFMVWRLFMLVLQRCNGTFISPLAAALATAFCIAMSFTLGAAVNTHALLIVMGWILILVITPGRQPLQTASPWLHTWVLTPTWHAFSLSFTTAISGRTFAMGMLIAVMLPLIIRRVFEWLAYFQLMATTAGNHAHVDNFICNMAALAVPVWENAPQKTMIFAKVFNMVPSFTFSAFFMLDAAISLLITLWIISLTTQRIRALTQRFAVVWAILLISATVLAAITIHRLIHPLAGNGVLVLAPLVLTFLPSRHKA